MKRYLLLCLLIALLGSCSKNTTDTPETPGGGTPVRFFTEVGTRGVSINTGNISEFGVFCYDLKGTTWDPSTSVPNKMNNLKVSRVYGTSDWSYGEPIDWEGGDGRRFSFTGYSPYATGMITDANPSGNNIEVLKKNIGTTEAPNMQMVGIPELSYETMEDVQQQVDLLVATPHISITPQENVHMKFGHSLVRIGFTAYSAQAYTTVQSIVISGVPYKGTMPIDGKNQWTIDPAKKDFTIDLQNMPVASADEQNPTDLSAGSGYFMLLPFDNSTETSKATVTFNYTLGGETKSHPYTFVQNWEAGKAYTYKINLEGVASDELLIKEVTIEDWNALTSETLDPGKPDLLTFSITYDANGGSNPPVAQNDLRGGSTVSLSTGQPTPPAKTNFIAWNTKADGTGTVYTPGQTFRIEGNMTLYAIYTPVPPYTVTFNANGGADAPTPITETEGGIGILIPDTRPTAPAGEDLWFVCWNTAANGSGTEVKIGETFYPTENTTLYAYYAPAIVIGNLLWTTGNLVADGANGCRVGAPTDYGLYFHCGSLVGWSGGAIGDGTGQGKPALAQAVTPMDYKGSTSWKAGYWTGGSADQTVTDQVTDDPVTGIGDPCRYYLGGRWRLPTRSEYSDLSSDNLRKWVANDGVNGYWVGKDPDNAAISIFLPASGCRHMSGGLFMSVAEQGFYWSSSAKDSQDASTFWIFSTGVHPVYSYEYAYGFSIRCVRNY